MGHSLEDLNPNVVPGAVVQRDENKIVRYLNGRFPTTGKTPEAAAANFLRSRADLLSLSPSLDELEHLITQRSLTGTHVRYRQVFNGMPVLDGYLSVHMDLKGNVVIVNNDLVPVSSAGDMAAKADPNSAVQVAVEAVDALTPPMSAPQAADVVYVADGRAHATTQVTFQTARPAGDWLVVVDNATGAVLHARNRAIFVDGAGLVFDPSPVVTSGIHNLPDNNDATSPTLDAERKNVVLKDLDGSGRLEGPFVTTTPTTGQTRALEPTNIFNYNRFDDRFEEVMCYFHLDRSQRYIQSLGFTNVNNRKQGVNVNGTTADNSFYSPSTKHVTFGTGGVDDAEDSDVILHEYGHSIHDNQVPGWGSSHEARSIGEGFGDYWAGSESAGVGPMAPGWDVYIAEWDAVSYNPGNPAFLRRLDSTKIYPTNMVNQVHADGEIWSAAMWQIRALVGRARADRIILEHHFLLGTGATMPQSANAILMVNQALYNGSDQDAIRQILINRGFITIAPSNLVANPINANRIDLAWTDNSSDETGFKIERKIAGGTFTQIATVGANVTQYQDSGVAADTTYVYRVRAARTAGDTLYSNEATATTPFTLFTISGTVTMGTTPLVGVGVTATGLGNYVHTQSVSPGMQIPDNNTTGITSSMVVTQQGTISSLRVGVNITHTYIGDLIVTLIHPDGTAVILHNRSGGSADNIVTSYPDQTTPAQSLSVLHGKPLNGTWQLRVQDVVAVDVGTLNSWSLRLNYSARFKASVKTNSSGAYLLTDVPSGTFRVEPEPIKKGSAWTPAFQNVTVGPNRSGINFSR